MFEKNSIITNFEDNMKRNSANQVDSLTLLTDEGLKLKSKLGWLIRSFITRLIMFEKNAIITNCEDNMKHNSTNQVDSLTF